MPYENRIVAYIDILGFKNLLDKTIDKENNDVEQNIEEVANIYNILRDIWDLDEVHNVEDVSNAAKHKNKSKEKVVTIFSDTIVVSFLQDAPSEIFFTLMEIKWMIMNLVNRGILCRGALAYGKLIHTDKMVFGPALVEAYTFENKAALYPRVILSRELIQLAGHQKSSIHSPKEEINYVEDLLKKDTDGMFYIDYFLGAQSELDDPELDFPIYLSKMVTMIKKGVRSLRPDVRIKYMWMREKINEVIEMGKNKELINRLKSTGKFDLAEAWSKVKKA